MYIYISRYSILVDNDDMIFYYYVFSTRMMSNSEVDDIKKLSQISDYTIQKEIRNTILTFRTSKLSLKQGSGSGTS